MRRLRSSMLHPRDAEQLAAIGGLFGGQRRFYKDGEGEGGGAGGGGGADWRAALPEDLRADPSLKDIKDVGALAKSYVSTKALMGRSIRIPTAEDGDDVRTEFRTKLKTAAPDLIEFPSDPEKRKAVEADIWEALGRPKDSDKGYTVEGVELSEGVKLTDEDVTQLRAVAKRRGYTKEQFKLFVADVGAEKAAGLAAQKKMNAELRAEFGAAYEPRMKEIAAIAEATGAPQVLRDSIAKGQIDKATAAYLLNVGKQLGTDTREISRQSSGGSGAMTPAEAEEQIGQLMPKFVNPKTPADERRRLGERLAKLERYAHPELVDREE